MSKTRRCQQCRKRLPSSLFSWKHLEKNAERKRYVKCHICHECQKVAKESRNDNGGMVDYINRDKLLRRLGFRSYAAYLSSETWKQIRKRVMDRAIGMCERCGEQATEVHHNQYTDQVLRGKSLRGLKAICRKCHEGIEFDGTRKRNVVEVSNLFYAPQTGW